MLVRFQYERNLKGQENIQMEDQNNTTYFAIKSKLAFWKAFDIEEKI